MILFLYEDSPRAIISRFISKSVNNGNIASDFAGSNGYVIGKLKTLDLSLYEQVYVFVDFMPDNTDTVRVYKSICDYVRDSLLIEKVFVVPFLSAEEVVIDTYIHKMHLIYASDKMYKRFGNSENYENYVKDLVDSIECLQTKKRKHSFYKSDCSDGYRDVCVTYSLRDKYAFVNNIYARVVHESMRDVADFISDLSVGYIRLASTYKLNGYIKPEEYLLVVNVLVNNPAVQEVAKCL